MRLDVENERALTFAQVCELLPARRGGARVHASTVYRWSTRGYRGVVLETWRIGGTRVTTLSALGRFIERLSGPAGAVDSAARPANQKEIARRLDAEGL